MDVSKVVGVDVGRRFKVRVGRGSGSGLGKTSGRGMNGAASKSGFGGLMHREGGQMPLIRRLPKRGFNNKYFRVDYAVLNVEQIARFAGEAITPDALKAHGILPKGAERLKVLGDGELTAKLDVQAHAFSASARQKIEAAGGTCTLIGRKPAPVVRKRPKSVPRGTKA
jgi:large subunit ribosomal protein L15